MQTGGQTDMTKLIVAFHSFVNAPKNWSGPAAGFVLKKVVTCYEMCVFSVTAVCSGKV